MVLYLTKVCEDKNVSQSSTVLHTVSLSRHILILRAQGGQHKARPSAEGKICIYQEQLHSCMYVLIYSMSRYLNIQMYLKLTKNLYCRRTVKMKNTIPSIAMANRFFPTKSQDKGSRFCLVPVDINKMNSSSKLTVVHAYWYLFISERALCKNTQPLKCVCHGLVLGHVNETSTQTEVREDQEHLLQDPVDLIQMLSTACKSNKEEIKFLFFASISFFFLFMFFNECLFWFNILYYTYCITIITIIPIKRRRNK